MGEINVVGIGGNIGRNDLPVEHPSTRGLWLISARGGKEDVDNFAVRLVLFFLILVEMEGFERLVTEISLEETMSEDV